MKSIKLILIFLVVAAIIFGIFIISSGTTSTTEREEEVRSYVKDDCDNIRGLWAKQSGWNAQLYDSLLRITEQFRANQRYNSEEYAEVRNTLREEAVNKANAGYMAALHTNDFRKDRLLEAYKGVKAIEEKEKMSGDDRVKAVEERQTLYTKISNFVNSSHPITARFDSGTMSWTSFDSQKNSYINQANNLKNNPLYGEMKHIQGFVSGLDTGALSRKFNNDRTTFYRNLLDQIYQYFKTAERTPRNKESIGTVSNKWYNEFNNSNSAKMMTTWTLLMNLREDYQN